MIFSQQYFRFFCYDAVCDKNIFVCFFVMFLLPPLEVSRVPQISAPDPPTHAACRFSTSAKNIFQAFRILLHFGGRGRRLQKNWNILYNGTLVLSLCLVIVPSHLLHSGLSCACSINVDFLKFLLPILIFQK